MIESESDFYISHGDEHERPCDEEERKLAALVTERKTALIAHDGVHHRETGAKTAHQSLDEHEPGDDTCDSGRLYIYREWSLVMHAGFVFLLLEKDNADDQVKKACSDKIRFAFGIRECRNVPRQTKKASPAMMEITMGIFTL